MTAAAVRPLWPAPMTTTSKSFTAKKVVVRNERMTRTDSRASHAICQRVQLEPVARRFPAVSFAVGADAYDQFMGRYSMPLAPMFADFAKCTDGLRVLDVGCGPGALTGELVRRLGPAAVTTVDPSESFVTAANERYPEVDVRRATAEELPLEDGTFDGTLAQLVVHFMKEPVVGLREMARVTRPGGVVAACVWDHEGSGGGPLSLFWHAAHEVHPDAPGESQLPEHARVTLSNSSKKPDYTRSRTRHYRSPSSTGHSTNGGSPLRSGWVQRVHSWPVSMPPDARVSARRAGRCCQPHRSR